MRSFTMLAAAALLLSACGTTTTSDTGGTPSTSTTTAVSVIQVTDAYVKAMDATATPDASAMTAAFMTIRNTSDRDVTLSGGSASFATSVQVHEVVGGVMRQKTGGLTIPAGGTVTLQPGGNHVMFMGMRRVLVAGDEARFTLAFADGSTVNVVAPVKAMNTGSESYRPMPTGGASTSSGMSM